MRMKEWMKMIAGWGKKSRCSLRASHSRSPHRHAPSRPSFSSRSPWSDPRQREGLRTMSSGEQVEAEFLNSMMNGLNGMVGGGEVWGAATANNNSNNSSNGGYPPHHHPHPQHPQQQRVRGEVYGVGNGVGVGVGLQQGRGSPTEGMRR